MARAEEGRGRVDNLLPAGATAVRRRVPEAPFVLYLAA